jgi:hypothetical protein
MKKLILSLSCMLFLIQGGLKADSPITSTPFYKAYEKNKMVKYAASKGVIDKKIAKFLLSDKKNIDQKAAVINALSWDIDGKSNTPVLISYVETKYKKEAEKIYLEDMSADDLFCLGYLIVMDNYFAPSNGLDFLILAKEKKPESYTINIIHALIQSQVYLDTFEWCRIWEICNEVNTNITLQSDMKDDAMKIIFEYIGLYESSCEE